MEVSARSSRMLYHINNRQIGKSEYRALLHESINAATTFSLITRDSILLSEEAVSVLRAIRAFQTSTTRVQEWPGTRLLATEATKYDARLTAASVALLTARAETLYSWRQAGLPEDLTFYRDDGSVWLATVAHEDSGFFRITDREATHLRQQIPTLHLTAAPESPYNNDPMLLGDVSKRGDHNG